MEEDIVRFTELDDTDVIQAIRVRESSDDFHFITFVQKPLSKGSFPKIISSSFPFSEECIQDKIRRVNQHFQIRKENGW